MLVFSIYSHLFLAWESLTWIEMIIICLTHMNIYPNKLNVNILFIKIQLFVIHILNYEFITEEIFHEVIIFKIHYKFYFVKKSFVVVWQDIVAISVNGKPVFDRLTAILITWRANDWQIKPKVP